jgi:chemotaxis protein histidine kinase CheA
MKDKDPNDDELNKDEQDNINEADDSFGLPDVDFNTLDEESEEEEDSTEESTESEDENVEEIEDSSQEETEEETAEDDEDSDATEAEEDTSVKRTYVPPKPESNTPKVVAALLITIVISVGVWYFMFYRPQAAAVEKAKIEAQAKADKAKKAAAAAKKKEAEEIKAAEAAANTDADADEEASSTATFTTISERTGRYYIVVQSNIDGDMAADKGRELAEAGTSTVLLSPGDKKTYTRLALAGDYASYVEAQEAANTKKSEFGETIWVFKY